MLASKRRPSGRHRSRSVSLGESRFPAISLALLSSLSWLAPQASPAASPPFCAAELASEITAITDRPELARSRWGILVQSLATDTALPHTLYQRDAGHYFIPASNAKLLTTAAILHHLGPTFRIRTTVYQVPDPNATVLQVVGQADPSLTDSSLASLAQQLKAAGIAQVDRLVLNESYLGGTFVNPTWEWEDLQAGYGAPLNSLIVNQNAIPLQLVPQRLGEPLGIIWEDAIAAATWQVENRSQTVAPHAPEFVAVGRDFGRPLAKINGHLRVGSEPEPVAIAVVDPTENFGQHFQHALQEQGIPVKERIVTTTPLPPSAIARATWRSPPLATLVQETNQHSNNLYAEALLAILGRTRPTVSNPVSPDTAPTDVGLATLSAVLSELGVEAQGYALADASGLSRHNLISPIALVQTLQAMARSPHAAAYRDSLAIMGQTGTLAQRLRVEGGKIHAKSGALRGVAALSGYLERPQEPPLAFSIMINQSTASYTTLVRAIDELVQVLTLVRSCPTEKPPTH